MPRHALTLQQDTRGIPNPVSDIWMTIEIEAPGLT
jgi:hypothetical protein